MGIASTELGEKKRTYFELCSKQKPIVVKPGPKDVYPPCDDKFVRIVYRNPKKTGYKAQMILQPYFKPLLNYRVDFLMSKPFANVTVIYGKDFKCNGNRCTFRNNEKDAYLVPVPNIWKAKRFVFKVTHPAGEHSLVA